MTQDDLLYRFRLQVFAMAAELGNVRAARRAMGIHPSTYYRWKQQLDRCGPEILRAPGTPDLSMAYTPVMASAVAWSGVARSR